MSPPIRCFRLSLFVLETLKFKKKIIRNVVSTLNWITPVIQFSCMYLSAHNFGHNVLSGSCESFQTLPKPYDLSSEEVLCNCCEADVIIQWDAIYQCSKNQDLHLYCSILIYLYLAMLLQLNCFLIGLSRIDFFQEQYSTETFLPLFTNIFTYNTDSTRPFILNFSRIIYFRVWGLIKQVSHMFMEYMCIFTSFPKHSESFNCMT